MRSPTQQEIADRLGISRATVSRVLRNAAGPKSSTAARIIETAREMGYRLPATANTAARKGAGRQKETVLGLLLCTPDERTSETSEVPMRILRGATDAARERCLLLHVEYITESCAAAIVSPEDVPVAFRKKSVSGVLLSGRLEVETVRLIQSRRPCVRLNQSDPGIQMDIVGQDDRTAVRELVMRLKEQGHRRIGYYCREPKASYALSRFAGYVEALAMMGLIYEQSATINVWEPSGEQAVERAVDAVRDGVSAWICAHDGCAFDLVRRFHKEGIRVPQDVSVCGFDHLPAPAGMPELMTIDWPLEDIAAAGVDMLLQRINEPARAPAQLGFWGRVIDGQSTGPVSGL
ncbi:LacI family DNA-binding transcriptional regulator [Tichowtungia aerotolerans]|uniref:Substrate-binding domain-containing protein n=1 Tax=Tichowtungia aerotolerans TaxID=2697043 RepID=A0A6P1MFT5_9BACT|nr:LacI family DNA-binding transcriptional regulator [Tichowtungia aerotolerans]QHI69935.1 substrate-binding domain-containing protein [Tichowtungia aerotolerans]